MLHDKFVTEKDKITYVSKCLARLEIMNDCLRESAEDGAMTQIRAAEDYLKGKETGRTTIKYRYKDTINFLLKRDGFYDSL